MKFFDQFGKAASQAMDRAKFEAEKFHRTSRIQGELGDIKQQLDDKLIELGQRTYDLYRAGQMSLPSVADLVKAIDELRIEIIKKEDELRIAQAEAYIEPPSTSSAPSPPPPVHEQPGPSKPGPDQARPDQANATTPAASSAGQATRPVAPQAGTKKCPACSFEMPTHAVFCPNCGFRVGTE